MSLLGLSCALRFLAAAAPPVTGSVICRVQVFEAGFDLLRLQSLAAAAFGGDNDDIMPVGAFLFVPDGAYEPLYAIVGKARGASYHGSYCVKFFTLFGEVGRGKGRGNMDILYEEATKYGKFIPLVAVFDGNSMVSELRRLRRAKRASNAAGSSPTCSTDATHASGNEDWRADGGIGGAEDGGSGNGHFQDVLGVERR